MAMTYTSLIAAIPEYIDRTDTSVSAQFDDFIQLAQQRMCVDLDKNLGFQEYIQRSFVIGDTTILKPPGWRRNVTFFYKDNSSNLIPIELRTYEYCVRYWPNTTIYSAPKFYSDYGYNDLYISPPPDDTYDYEFGVFQDPVFINSTDNPTNWFTVNAPQILLAATILEALRFQKNYEEIPAWDQNYKDGIEALQSQNEARSSDRGSDRSSAT